MKNRGKTQERNAQGWEVQVEKVWMKKAFSIFELSIVILIAAFLSVGVMQGGEMVRKAKVTSAASATKASVVGKMDGLVAWYETTMPNSISNNEAADGVRVSTWYDISNTSTTPINATQSTQANQPTYANNGINGLPILRFDGGDNLVFTTTPPLVNSNYTVIVVEQRTSNKSNNYFIGAVGGGTNQKLVLGYNATNLASHAQGGASGYTISVPSYDGPIPRIFTFILGQGGKDTYINGVNTHDSSTATLTSWTSANIGLYNNGSDIYYVGDIGEIIMFNRTLNTQERRDIEEYLSKKWGITVS